MFAKFPDEVVVITLWLPYCPLLIYKYPLVTLLHLADMSATYLNERTSLNETQPQKIQGKF